jgi:NAD(P)H-flavin reductase
MNPFIPQQAEVLEKVHVAKNIYNYRLRFCDPGLRRSFGFSPGQFNMVYVFGVGEVPISISSDPAEAEVLDHTIRIVGTVTRAIGELKKGDIVGLRGPYGSHWPLEQAKGKDVVVVTGGLGCAPVVGAINYIIKRRKFYGTLKILHGIKTPRDLIYREKFLAWEKIPNTKVYLSSDQADEKWRYHIGFVTNLLDKAEIDPENCTVMMCGPDIMMRLAIKQFLEKQVSPDKIYLSLEKNMKCALGFCGHCQYGPHFICKDGPILRYDLVQHIFNLKEI